MDRMKTFFMYVLIIVLVYVLSNVLINVFIKISYNDIEKYEVTITEPYINITEAKASKRDGKIKGFIKNNTNSVIENKFIKFSMLSEYNNVLGEKYVRIDKLEKDELKNFEVKFDYKEVKTFTVEIVDTKPEDVDFIELVKTNIKDLTNQNK